MRFPIARLSLSLAVLLLLGGCFTEFRSELILPFEALPEAPENPPCRVLIGLPGPRGLAESDLDRRRLVGQSDAELSILLHERLDTWTEELGPGQQVTGTASDDGFQWIWQGLRATTHGFSIYASCLADDGWFICRNAPMAKGKRSAVRCPYERFGFEQGEPALAEGSRVVVEYTPFPCSRGRDIRGLPDPVCGWGWSIVLHRIRRDDASGSEVR